jgi:uncharacterized repeat protein (TIGR03803 family)
MMRLRYHVLRGLSVVMLVCSLLPASAQAQFTHQVPRSRERKAMRIVSSGMAISLAALTPVGGALAAPVESVLHSFTGVAGDGAHPQAALIADESGALFGTTVEGGNNVGGVVFKLSPPGRGQTVWSETVLHSFTGVPGDGELPRGALIADEGGALYGTTVLGGSSSCSGLGCGTVFKLTPPSQGQTAWTETVLYSFKGGNDGANPSTSLIADDRGALYGTTELGGSGTSCFGSGCGTVFKLTPPADGQTVWTETVLYRFTGGSDGHFPAGSLIADERGALYGTTSSGGSSNCAGGCGTVFKLTPPADGQTVWTETVLYSFEAGNDGADPSGSLIADDSGALYGTTFLGGSSNCSGFGCGAVFKLSPPAKGETSWTETVLYSFKGGSDGAGPSAPLIADDRGALYGTTSGGGVGPSALCPGSNVLFTGCGTVFKLKPPGDRRTAWTETVLYRFTGGSDGSDPATGLTAPVTAGESQEAADENRKDGQEDRAKGVLYGTTNAGGTSCPFSPGTCGTVFKLTLCPDGRDGDHGGCPILE